MTKAATGMRRNVQKLEIAMAEVTAPFHPARLNDGAQILVGVLLQRRDRALGLSSISKPSLLDSVLVLIGWIRRHLHVVVHPPSLSQCGTIHN